MKQAIKYIFYLSVLIMVSLGVAYFNINWKMFEKKGIVNWESILLREGLLIGVLGFLLMLGYHKWILEEKNKTIGLELAVFFLFILFCGLLSYVWFIGFGALDR